MTEKEKELYWHTVERCNEYVINMLPEHLADTYSLDVDDIRETLIEWYRIQDE